MGKLATAPIVPLLAALTVSMAIGTLALPVRAELGSDVPSDAQLLTQRVQEGGSSGSGIFDIPVPPPGTVLRPVERVSREQFGVVGPFPLTLQDLPALIFPNATSDESQELLEGLTFLPRRTRLPKAWGRSTTSRFAWAATRTRRRASAALGC